MGRTKVKSGFSVFSAVFDGLKTYFYNLDIFLKYLAFPVLGIIFGAFILFAINYFFIINLDNIQTSNPVFENTAVILTLLIILTIPGFLIMIKAFVDYLIAFGALNSMCVLGAKRIEDVYSHKETIKRRMVPYCVLIFLISAIFLTLSFPLFLPILIIMTVFLSLSFQVFTLDESSNPVSAIKGSFNIVKGNFWKIFWVLVLLVAISYVAIPYLINWAIMKTPLFHILTVPVEKYLSLLPVSDINYALEEMKISYTFDTLIVSEIVVSGVIMGAVTMFMLPFRCACMVNLYKAHGNDFENSKEEIKAIKPKKTRKGKI